MSRSKRLGRVANAAPIIFGHLVGGRSSPHVQLVDPFIFLFEVADAVPNQGLVSAHRGYEVLAPRNSALHNSASVLRTPVPSGSRSSP